MKKLHSHFPLFLFILTIFTLTLLTNSLPTAAASQTTRLNPTAAVVGTAQGTVSSSSSAPLVAVFGGSITSPNNALQEDGNVATLDPSTTINGADYNSDSYLYLDYQKNTLCSKATIQAITVHTKWTQNTSTPQNDAAALLVKLEDPAQLKFTYNSDTAEYGVTDQVFGGVASSQYGGSSTGNPPATLTEETGSVANLPTLAQLNDPNTRIYLSLGENPGGVVGQVDSVWLEVTHDDTACTTTTGTVDQPKPPKTGPSINALAAITAFAGAFIAGLSLALVLLHRPNKTNQVK